MDRSLTVDQRREMADMFMLLSRKFEEKRIGWVKEQFSDNHGSYCMYGSIDTLLVNPRLGDLLGHAMHDWAFERKGLGDAYAFNDGARNVGEIVEALRDIAIWIGVGPQQNSTKAASPGT